MSRFSPNSKKELPPEFWEAEADLQVSGIGADHMIIITGACLSLFMSMFASPGVGLFTVALIIFGRLKSQRESGRAGEAIKDKGLVAPFLKGDSFRDYVAAVGPEEVSKQVEYAQANRYQLTLDAATFMKHQSPKVLPVVPPSTEIGEATKLNAIDVPSVPVKKEARVLVPQHPESLLALPLRKRAELLIQTLKEDGFDLGMAIQTQITCICGNQRGGKGTLMAILAILSKAADPTTKVHYFTAGDDVYPFKCDRLVCRLNYPKADGIAADGLVARDLFDYLKLMDKSKVGAYEGVVLVIDEAVALCDYLSVEDKKWMIRFLLSRTNKKGAQSFIVLHGNSLSSWLGTGNTDGYTATFKEEVTFIGCEKTSKKVGPLKAINLASGRYFLASPDSFNKPLEGGELGAIPDWLKSETNPATGHPDPARTLLKFFPELVDEDHFGLASEVPRPDKKKLEAIPGDGIETIELKISDSLGEPLQTIWKFAKEQADWVTVRDIYRKEYAVLKDKNCQNIRRYLGILSDKGMGEIEEEGKADSAVRFKAF